MKKILFTLSIGALLFSGVSVAWAVTNISATVGEHYAWNDVTGWIDFYATSNINVTNTQLQGYANALQFGSLGLDCATSPNGNICSGPAGNWFVSNDGNGNLAGWAWSDNFGWVSFCGSAGGGSGWNGSTWVCPAGTTYQVKIDLATGDFSGWAWNDVIGWISFNCNNSGIGLTCSTSDYKVKTSWTNGPPPPVACGPSGFDCNTWLISSVFDTQVTGGAAFNSILWHGSQPAGTAVGFQIAASNNSGGPWTYIGPDGTSSTLYNAAQGVQTKLSRRYHNNYRYIRYRAWLLWAGSQAPRVDDVIINYSP